MRCKEHKEFPTRRTWIGIVAFLVGIIFSPRVLPAVTVGELAAMARQEGALSAGVSTSILRATTPKLVTAFKKRFKLDINVTITQMSDTKHFPKAATATKAGVAPTFDTLYGSEKNTIQLMGLGGVQKIDGWETLLAEINPLVSSGKVRPNQISSEPFTGYAFQYTDRLKALMYNPRLISKEELPNTHADLADPKYKGRWTQPPFSSHWDIGPLAFPNLSTEEWLEIVRKAGKNAGAVQMDQRGIQRVMLGEFAFALVNVHAYFRVKNKDSQAPAEITFFKDYNPVTIALYMVRKGTRHPAAATLFAMWMTTPEAKAIWQPMTFETQFLWGEGELEKRVKQLLKEAGGKVVHALATQRGRDFIRWMGTPEGRKYRKAVSKGIRGKKWKRKKRSKR